MGKILQPGQPAPEFEARDQNGNTISLKSLSAQPVILYFYPKDDTPGCTAEACSFRDSMKILRQRGVTVIGISVDSEASHAKFSSKHNLDYSLLSDRERKIVAAYGVETPLKTARRVTYIIGTDGIIKHVFTSVNAKTHAEDVLRKMRELRLA
jgi:peroxiredoxin Q/BCP